MPTILLIGFRPFQGRSINGSESLASALNGLAIAEHTIVGTSIPVEWNSPTQEIPQLVAQHSPSLILGLGERKHSSVFFERQAFSDLEGIDEAGRPAPAPTSPLPIRPSTLQFSPAWFNDHPISVLESTDPGRYLCNHLFYTALSLDSPPTGFLHIPVQGDTKNDKYVPPLTSVVLRLLERNIAI